MLLFISTSTLPEAIPPPLGFGWVLSIPGIDKRANINEIHNAIIVIMVVNRCFPPVRFSKALDALL